MLLRLPALAVTLALLAGCGDTESIWVAVWTRDGLEVIDGPHDHSRILLPPTAAPPPLDVEWEDDLEFRWLDFSPDGRYVGLWGGRILDLTGAVYTSETELERPAWHPRGHALLGIRDEDPRWLGIDGTWERVRVSGCDTARSVALRGDGEKLAVVCSGGSDTFGAFEVRVADFDEDDLDADDAEVVGQGRIESVGDHLWPRVLWGDAGAIILANPNGAGDDGLDRPGLHVIEEDGSDSDRILRGQVEVVRLSPGGTRLVAWAPSWSDVEVVDTSDWSTEPLPVGAINLVLDWPREPLPLGTDELGLDWVDDRLLCYPRRPSDVGLIDVETGEFWEYSPSQPAGFNGAGISCFPG